MKVETTCQSIVQTPDLQSKKTLIVYHPSLAKKTWKTHEKTPVLAKWALCHSDTITEVFLGVCILRYCLKC